MQVIQPYNAKVQQVLGNNKIGKPLFPIYYGVEYEFEVPVASASKEAMLQARSEVGLRIKDTIKNFAFTKHDGSLKNGFEVVSVPMSKDAHITQWDDFFAKAKKEGLVIRST